MNIRSIVIQGFVAVGAFGLFFGCSRSDETAKPAPSTDAPSARDQNPGQGTFGDVFGPGGLAPATPGEEPTEEAPAPTPSNDPEARMRNPGQGSFGDVFGSGLTPGSTPTDEGTEAGPDSEDAP